MGKLGLVTVLYNSDDVLEDFIKSIHRQGYDDYIIIFIDNSADDRSFLRISELTKEYPLQYFEYIYNNGNEGVAKGNNQGIVRVLELGCEYILLLNNDIEFLKVDIFEDLITFAEGRNEKVVVPKILFHDTKKIWMAGGAMLNFRVANIHFGYNDANSNLHNEELYCNYAPTCFMLLHKSIFEEIGLMDESYFVYYDDTDFSKRLIEAGFRIYYLPKFEIFHKESSSTGGSQSLFSIFYINRNRIYFYRKHYKGFFRVLSFFFLLASCIFRFLKYNKQERSCLKRAVNEGLNMPILRQNGFLVTANSSLFKKDRE